MKKLIILLLLISCGITGAFAQSMLKVSLADKTPVNISVDGRYFNKRGSTVTVGDLPPGKHILKIFVTSQDRRGRARDEVVYEGKVKTRQGLITMFVFDANSGNIDLDDEDMSSYVANNPPPPVNNNNNNNYNNNNYQGNNGYNQGNNRYNNAPAAPQGTLTDSKVSTLKDQVAAKASDTQKMDVLKDGLKDEQFTTDQVGIIMDWFIFESSKVSFAEWAYTNTVDKYNYKNLENKFSYKNSQDDLDKFLQGKR